MIEVKLKGMLVVPNNMPSVAKYNKSGDQVKIYESMTAAGDDNKNSKCCALTTISKRCKDGKPCKHGFIWKKLEDEEISSSSSSSSFPASASSSSPESLSSPSPTSSSSSSSSSGSRLVSGAPQSFPSESIISLKRPTKYGPMLAECIIPLAAYEIPEIAQLFGEMEEGMYEKMTQMRDALTRHTFDAEGSPGIQFKKSPMLNK